MEIELSSSLSHIHKLHKRHGGLKCNFIRAEKVELKTEKSVSVCVAFALRHPSLLLAHCIIKEFERILYIFLTILHGFVSLLYRIIHRYGECSAARRTFK